MKKAMRRIGIRVGSMLAALVILGCTTTQPYWTDLAAGPDLHGKLNRPVAAEPNRHCLPPSQVCIAFVEFDDYGNAMNRAQLLGAVQEAEAAARTGSTVLVYFHGWHENARRGAPDLNQFLELVQRASSLSQASGNASVFGIYVGWRGDSIAVRAADSANPKRDVTTITALPSYALTFWERKDAAQRIGASGGVYELIKRLSAIRLAHKDSRLVLQGHSFGGALLYSAMSQPLVEQIMRDGLSYPGERKRPSRPFADLVVLLNPAFEAMRVRPHVDLARSYEYPNGPTADDFLPPRLIIITSDADTATRVAFTAGRVLGTLTSSYTSDDGRSRAENTTAVGHYIPLVTHQLTPILNGACPAGRVNPMALNQSVLCISPEGEAGSAVPLLLTRCDNPGDCAHVAGKEHFLQRGPVAEGYLPFRLPILNVRTVGTVIGSHTDIWQPTFQNFLAQLAALGARDPGAIPMMPVTTAPSHFQ